MVLVLYIHLNIYSIFVLVEVLNVSKRIYIYRVTLILVPGLMYYKYFGRTSKKNFLSYTLWILFLKESFIFDLVEHGKKPYLTYQNGHNPKMKLS